VPRSPTSGVTVLLPVRHRSVPAHRAASSRPRPRPPPSHPLQPRLPRGPGRPSGGPLRPALVAPTPALAHAADPGGPPPGGLLGAAPHLTNPADPRFRVLAHHRTAAAEAPAAWTAVAAASASPAAVGSPAAAVPPTPPHLIPGALAGRPAEWARWPDPGRRRPVVVPVLRGGAPAPPGASSAADDPRVAPWSLALLSDLGWPAPVADPTPPASEYHDMPTPEGSGDALPPSRRVADAARAAQLRALAPRGCLALDGRFFDQPPRPALLHRAVTWQLSKRRQGTHATLSRAEVRGGGRKPWKQKGTGRARQGSRRSPLWVGGGRAHAREPVDWSTGLNKKERRLALATALSARAHEGRLSVVDSLTDGLGGGEEGDAGADHGGGRPRTRVLARALRAGGLRPRYVGVGIDGDGDGGSLPAWLKDVPRRLMPYGGPGGAAADGRSTSILLVDAAGPRSPGGWALRAAAGNLPNVSVVAAAGLSVYAILRHDHLCMDPASVAAVARRLDRPNLRGPGLGGRGWRIPGPGAGGGGARSLRRRAAVRRSDAEAEAAGVPALSAMAATWRASATQRLQRRRAVLLPGRGGQFGRDGGRILPGRGGRARGWEP